MPQSVAVSSPASEERPVRILEYNGEPTAAEDEPRNGGDPSPPKDENGSNTAGRKVHSSRLRRVRCREYRISPAVVVEGKNSSSNDLSASVETANVTDGPASLPVSASSAYGVFARLFLPVDFPHSVGPAYLRYQMYDSLQGLCSYLRGVVSTSAVLKAAGVGSADATAMGAAVTWAMRDGIGMIGGLLFSYVASAHYDAHVKEFRLFADVINDVGLTLDMLAPLLCGTPGSFLWVSAVATVCKVMCGMAAGATKASITAHFALRGNMADLNAKESTQETLATLVGMSLGIALARQIHYLEERDERAAFHVVWFVFISLTVLHVWANYKGVKLLRLKTLNRERAELALGAVIDATARRVGGIQTGTPLKSTKIASSLTIFPPEAVSESLLASTGKLLLPGKVRLGVPMQALLRGGLSSPELRSLTGLFADEKYMLSVNWRNGEVYVALRCGARESDELKSFVHAMVVRRCLDNNNGGSSSLKRMQNTLLQDSCREINNLFDNGDESKVAARKANERSPCENSQLSLDLLSRCGWDCGRLYLGFGQWRIEWESKDD